MPNQSLRGGIRKNQGVKQETILSSTIPAELQWVCNIRYDENEGLQIKREMQNLEPLRVCRRKLSAWDFNQVQHTHKKDSRLQGEMGYRAWLTSDRRSEEIILG